MCERSCITQWWKNIYLARVRIVISTTENANESTIRISFLKVWRNIKSNLFWISMFLFTGNKTIKKGLSKYLPNFMCWNWSSYLIVHSLTQLILPTEWLNEETNIMVIERVWSDQGSERERTSVVRPKLHFCAETETEFRLSSPFRPKPKLFYLTAKNQRGYRF